ncbi:type III-B CRISPR module RAMP protein Cmr1 [Sulfolobales archaeon HS-7]|nr:type III-B CRISPR module RAMP protein Cmr1 [Sulfolobales archaeon HS-7]
MEELLLSFKLSTLYPLTGGYNRHSVNSFYREWVRPTEIKGLWRWWTRVLFNTVSYAKSKDKKLYTYDAIDRFFEDVFGSENKKSSIRLEVVTEQSDEPFQLPNLNLDEVTGHLKGYNGKIYLELRDNKLIIELENLCKCPNSFSYEINLDKDEIKESIYKNKLFSFELSSFNNIKVTNTNISDKENLEAILRNLIADYLECFIIRSKVEFTLNIYLRRYYENGEENKKRFDTELKFALHSLLLYLLLGGLGRKTTRGFGSLSIMDVKCYDSVCSDLENYIKEFLKVKNEKELKDKLAYLIHKATEYNIILPDKKLIEADAKDDSAYYYFIPEAFPEKVIFVNEINPNKIEDTLNAIPEATTERGKCTQLIQNRSVFLKLFCGHGLNKKQKGSIHRTSSRDKDHNYKFSIEELHKKFYSKGSKSSALRFKILNIDSNKSFLLTYLLIPSYIKYVQNLVEDNYCMISKDLKTMADCVSKT